MFGHPGEVVSEQDVLGGNDYKDFVNDGNMGARSLFPGIPENINMLKYAHKKALCAHFPVIDKILVAVAAKDVLVANHFPRMAKTWESLSHSEKAWEIWRAD